MDLEGRKKGSRRGSGGRAPRPNIAWIMTDIAEPQEGQLTL